MKMIPYGRQYIDEEDIQAVTETLKSDYLTTGSKVIEFEDAVSDYTSSKFAVTLSSGTAALHSTMYALGISHGDEVIVPPLTFAATVNSIIYQGGTPVFADVDPETLLLDPMEVQRKITPKTKAVVTVDYAGHPSYYESLRTITTEHNISFISDGCHSLGGEYKGKKVGSLADMTVFSFHPVKNITTGEGGMVTTNNMQFAERIRLFRNHGINSDFRQRSDEGTWFYEMIELGYNYRLSDIHCALGLSQLKKLPLFLARRNEIARRYDKAFVELEGVNPLMVTKDIFHAYHLYVIRLDVERIGLSRDDFYKAMRNMGIGVNVHYIPVHLHPFYKKQFGLGPGLCPVTEKAYEEILSLPIYPSLDDEQIKRVVDAVRYVSQGN